MDGFLPFSRASFMLDFVASALIGVVLVFGYSIFVAKYQKKYLLHKRLQIVLTIILGLVLLFFEIDMRINGWVHLAEESPHFATYLFPSLILHLVCAITTVILWSYTMYGALKNFSPIPSPNLYSMKHKRLAKLTTIFMFLTIATAWLFFYVAFVAQ